MQYHDAPVTWKLRFDVPQNAPTGDYPISGLIGYQVCEVASDGGNVCELPQAVRFAGTLKVGDATAGDGAPLAFRRPKDTGKSPTLPPFSPTTSTASH